MKKLNMNAWRGFPFFYQKLKGNIIDVSHNDTIEIGDQMYRNVEVRNGQTIILTQEVLQIIDSRPARGDWKGMQPHPTWYRLQLGEPIRTTLS